MGRIPLKSPFENRGFGLCCLALFFLVGISSSAMSQEPPESSANSKLNLPTKTLGGKQFWTDVRFQGGWKIQQNALTGHFRLLDKSKVLRAWGTLAACQNVLDRAINDGTVKPTSGRVVIVLHGLIRTSNSMGVVGKYLQKNSNMTAISYEYASTRKSVKQHAESLGQLIDGLGKEVTEINFVGHSMGNIVVRRYLFAETKGDRQGDPRIKRMVMIGPPNQGSQMALMLKKNFIFKVVAGAAGAQMGETWEHLAKKLAIPKFEFGIIAGGQSDENQRFSNMFVDGKDDFTVGVEETKLAGATDFLVKPLLHSTMMKQPVTLKATLSFLEHGYFTTKSARQPLPSEPKK